MTKLPIGWAIQRYWPSVVFPTAAFWSIYADWSHTQEWKRTKNQKQGETGVFCYSSMSFTSYILKGIANNPWQVMFPFFPVGGYFLGKMFDDAETERMTRFRDRSALYGRPPPPPGVKEVPSW